MLESSHASPSAERLGTLNTTVSRARAYLLDSQHAEGYWWGELESNPTMEAEYLLLTHFLGLGDAQRWSKLTNHILSRQRADGTWGQFYDAPGDLSTSTECYFALKLAGYSPDEPFMIKARDFILSKGGVPNTRVFTKIWLALFGQWSWRGVPAMPPEAMLLPDWFPINIYDLASWARATVVPMFILLDRKPVREIPQSACIDELYPRPRSETDYSLGRPKRLMGWETLFYAGDAVLKRLDKIPWKPTRRQAIKRAEKWVLDHQEADGSWGGIQPPWVYSLMALSSLGYPSSHEVIARGMAGFDSYGIEDDDTLRIQACISPLWDTGLAMIALLDSGIDPDHPALTRAGGYLLQEQILNGGDWQVRARGVPAGGWAFEFHNDVYPDLDDTAEIVLALNRTELGSYDDKSAAIDRAVGWTLGMQCRNGGWGAFDKNNTKSIIAKIPFADFGETIDPPSVDVTAHILEMLGQLGYGLDHPAVVKAIKYVFAEQEDDGPWFGRWGVNYIYGTGAVLPALEALGVDMSIGPVRRATRWIFEHQNPDGGWGESCTSYVDVRAMGRGPSTPSQTAWALIALIAAGEGASPATIRGVEHLVRTQRDNGSWDEPYFTGTGFPGYGIGQRLDRFLTPEDNGYQGAELPAGFMINYHMYRNYWPLMALGRYRRSLEGKSQNARPETASGFSNGRRR
jgi:squalene-hopene/tetraprenyl-beta-curcumene cyclase